MEFLSSFDSKLPHINYDDYFGAYLESNLTWPESDEEKKREDQGSEEERSVVLIYENDTLISTPERNMKCKYPNSFMCFADAQTNTDRSVPF